MFKQLAVCVAAQHGGEVEAESVHMHFLRPVFETIDNKLSGDRMVTVKGVAASAPVGVGAIVINHVISCLVETPEIIYRSVERAFSGVIENDIENDFYTGGVQRFDEHFKFSDRCARLTGCGVATHRRKKGEGAVTPEIEQVFACGAFDKKFQFVEFKQRQKFNGGNAERFQIWNFPNKIEIGSAGFIAREAAQVRFVNYGLFERSIRAFVVAPVKGVVRDKPFREMLSGADVLSGPESGGVAPDAREVNGTGIRIEQPLFGNGIGTVEIKSAGLQSGYRGLPVRTAGHFNFAGRRFGIGGIKKQQPEPVGAAVNDELNSGFMNVYAWLHGFQCTPPAPEFNVSNHWKSFDRAGRSVV